MVDALEDDLVRKYEEEHQARKSKSSASSTSEDRHNNSVGSANSQGKAEGEASSQVKKQMSDPVPGKHHGAKQESGSVPGEDAGFLDNLKIEEQKQPNKSGSMGLLDAEGYKFLDGSDSNSEEQNPRNVGSAENGQKGEPVAIAENGPQQQSSAWQNQHQTAEAQAQSTLYEVRPKVMKIEQINFEDIQIAATRKAQEKPRGKKQPRRQSNTNQKMGDKKSVVQSEDSEAAPTAAKRVTERIEKEPIDPQRISFYPDGSQKLSDHGGSRLGQRSSRMALQAELE